MVTWLTRQETVGNGDESLWEATWAQGSLAGWPPQLKDKALQCTWGSPVPCRLVFGSKEALSVDAESDFWEHVSHHIWCSFFIIPRAWLSRQKGIIVYVTQNYPAHKKGTELHLEQNIQSQSCPEVGGAASEVVNPQSFEMLKDGRRSPICGSIL